MIFDQAWLTAVRDGKHLVSELGETVPHVPPPYRGVIKQAVNAVCVRFEDNLFGGLSVDEDLMNLKQLVKLVDSFMEDSYRNQKLAESFANVQATLANDVAYSRA